MTVKKCTKRCDARAKFLFCLSKLYALSTFSLPSPASFLNECLRRDVFERRTSTGSGFFAILGRDFEQMVGHIGSIRVKTVLTTNLV